MNKVKDATLADLSDLTKKQEIIYIASIKRILKKKKTLAKKMKLVDDLRVKFQKDLDVILKEYMQTICLFGLRQVSKELKFKNPKKLSSQVNSWIKSMVDTVSMKYLSELNMFITVPVLDSIMSNFSDAETIYRVQLVFQEFTKSKHKVIINTLEGRCLYQGRNLGVLVFNKDIKLEGKFLSFFKLAPAIDELLQRERVVAAQWSAILDAHVCELCASMDGKIIDINSPDYAYFNPGQIHPNCRCLWVYITSSERPENRVVDWKTPSSKLIKTYMFKEMKDAKSIKKRRIIDEDENIE